MPIASRSIIPRSTSAPADPSTTRRRPVDEPDDRISRRPGRPKRFRARPRTLKKPSSTLRRRTDGLIGGLAVCPGLGTWRVCSGDVIARGGGRGGIREDVCSRQFERLSGRSARSEAGCAPKGMEKHMEDEVDDRPAEPFW